MGGLSIGYKVHNPYLISAIATIGGMLFGFDISSVSAFIGDDNYKQYFNYPSPIEQSGITASMPGGSFLGCLIAGWVSDTLGRKFAIQIASTIWMVGCAIQSSSQNVAQLICGRVIAGFAIGMCSSQVPVYLAELAPTKIRGRLVGAFQWSVTWGILIMFYISFGCTHMNGTSGFRTAWGIQMVPGFLLFLGTLVLDESPRWLATRDRWEEAIQVIANVQAKGDINNETVRLEIMEIKQAVAIEHNARVGIREMFSGSTNLRRTFVGLSCQVWQQFTGMNVMMYYIVDIFEMSGFSNSSSTTVVASSIQYVINVVCTIPSLLFIDSWGRRKLLIFGAVAMMAWLWAAVGIYGTYSVPSPGGYLPPNSPPGAQPNAAVTFRIPQDRKPASKAAIAVSYLFVAFFAPTWGPGGWVYCSEIFPLEQRATGNGITAAANWICNFAISMFTLPAFESITWKTYCIYAACCFGMAVHVFLMFPETKGRTLEEIDAMWKANVPAWRSSSWTPDFPIDDLTAPGSGMEKHRGETEHSEGTTISSGISVVSEHEKNERADGTVV